MTQLMDIAFDARALNVDFVRGIGRCMQEVISRCNDKDVFDKCHLLSNRPDLPVQIEKAPNMEFDLRDVPGNRFKIWEQLYLPFKALRTGAQLLHCPANNLPLWQPLKTIVTLHDAMPWLGNESSWPRGLYTDRLIPYALHKATAIITISETSKRDILSFWPDFEEKLSVISNGVSKDFLQYPGGPLDDELLKIGLQKPYLLYLGGPIQRKRLDWALQVFSHLHNTSVTLAVCGVSNEVVRELCQQHCPHYSDQVIALPFISDSVMPNLYYSAEAILYPTLYEGFGLPALEAQAVGTPALFSSVGSLSELIGPKAIVLPVDEMSAWVDALQEIIATSSDTCQIDIESRRWARKFSWDVCATKHAKIYRSLSN